MVQTTLKVDGMMCGMCESHVNEVVRKTVQVEKVTSSHTKGETVIVSAQPLDIEALKAAIGQYLLRIVIHWADCTSRPCGFRHFVSFL